MTLRIGHGYDLHRLDRRPPYGLGRPMVLGGVGFDSDLGPVGHSDADVLLHAITDAILGALGEPDIGRLFPDTDPLNAERDSAQFLAEAVRRMADAGWRIQNLDATVVAETPKVGPAKDAIRARLASLLGVDPGRVNVKGKTHEGVDAVGRREAIEAHAVVLLTCDLA